MWATLPGPERIAAVQADSKRFIPMQARFLADATVRKCEAELERYLVYSTEPDQGTKVGVWAGGVGNKLTAWGQEEQAERVYKAAADLLEAVVFG
jgi:hypothetical protein